MELPPVFIPAMVAGSKEKAAVNAAAAAVSEGSLLKRFTKLQRDLPDARKKLDDLRRRFQLARGRASSPQDVAPAEGEPIVRAANGRPGSGAIKSSQSKSGRKGKSSGTSKPPATPSKKKRAKEGEKAAASLSPCKKPAMGPSKEAELAGGQEEEAEPDDILNKAVNKFLSGQDLA